MSSGSEDGEFFPTASECRDELYSNGEREEKSDSSPSGNGSDCDAPDNEQEEKSNFSSSEDEDTDGDQEEVFDYPPWECDSSDCDEHFPDCTCFGCKKKRVSRNQYNNRYCFLRDEDLIAGHEVGDEDRCKNCGALEHKDEPCKPMCMLCKDYGHKEIQCRSKFEVDPSMDCEYLFVKYDVRHDAKYVPVDSDEVELFKGFTQRGEFLEKLQNAEVQYQGRDEPRDIPRSFQEMGLSHELIANIDKAGFTFPLPIESHLIPLVNPLQDVVGFSPTGSGKTTAYLMGIIKYLIDHDDLSLPFETYSQPRALILLPTHESAEQTAKQAEMLAYGTPVKVERIYGGMAEQNTIFRIKSGASIIVGTLGALIRFRSRNFINFAKLRFLVIDEFDSMDDLHQNIPLTTQCKWFVERMPHFKTPSDRTYAIMLLSATFHEFYKLNHSVIALRPDMCTISIGRVCQVNPCIQQRFINAQYLFNEFDDKRKSRMLTRCAWLKRKFAGVDPWRVEKMLRSKQFSMFNILLDLLIDDIEKNSRDENERYKYKTIVFMSSRDSTIALASKLEKMGIPARPYCQNLNQTTRAQNVKDFKNGVFPILVATDVGARGLDIEGLEHVINYEQPNSYYARQVYIQRLGRTGRVGNTGRATTFWTYNVASFNDDPRKWAKESDDLSEFIDWLKKTLIDADQKMPDFIDKGFDEALEELQTLNRLKKRRRRNPKNKC